MVFGSCVDDVGPDGDRVLEVVGGSRTVLPGGDLIIGDVSSAGAARVALTAGCFGANPTFTELIESVGKVIIGLVEWNRAQLIRVVFREPDHLCTGVRELYRGHVLTWRVVQHGRGIVVFFFEGGRKMRGVQAAERINPVVEIGHDGRRRNLQWLWLWYDDGGSIDRRGACLAIDGSIDVLISTEVHVSVATEVHVSVPAEVHVSVIAEVHVSVAAEVIVSVLVVSEIGGRTLGVVERGLGLLLEDCFGGIFGHDLRGEGLGSLDGRPFHNGVDGGLRGKEMAQKGVNALIHFKELCPAGRELRL